jgi:hypothetical protein
MKENPMRKLLGISFAVIALFSLTSCGVVTNLQSVTDTGNAFMQALKDGDNSTSWNMLTQSVKDEIGGETAWADFTAPRNFDEWSFNSTNIENTTGVLEGEAKLDDETYIITLVMEANGDGWLISGINIELK